MTAELVFPVRVVLVSGSRDWPDKLAARIWRDLDEQREMADAEGTLLVMHGACPDGADLHAREWVDRHKAEPTRGLALVAEDPHPADWDTCAPSCPSRPGHRKAKPPGDRLHPGRLDTYCPGAGPRRNAAMVRLAIRRGLAVGLVYRLDTSSGATGTLRELERARANYTHRQAWSRPGGRAA